MNEIILNKKRNGMSMLILITLIFFGSILLFILSVLNLPYTTGMEKDKEELFKWEKNLF